MALGQSRVWLPQFVLKKSISRERFKSLIERHLPKLLRLERLVQPRYWPFANRDKDEIIIGWLALVLALAVTIPIPLGNWLPALSVLMIALALSERDGFLFYAGLFLGTLSLAVIAAVIGAAGALAGILMA